MPNFQKSLQAIKSHVPWLNLFPVKICARLRRRLWFASMDKKLSVGQINMLPFIATATNTSHVKKQINLEILFHATHSNRRRY